MSTPAINNLNSATTPAVTTASSTSTLANQNVFLQLLVAQLKYQDPDNPPDGTAFITQLAQFSELSNTTDMASDLDAMKADLSTAAVNAPSGTNGAGGTSQPSTNSLP